MANEPFVALTYGPSGVGKTVDQGYSFPNALFVAAPGALSSVASVCGYEPKSVSLSTIQDVTRLFSHLTGKFDTVVIDDFSFLAEQTLAQLDKKFTGFKLWGEMRDVALEFRDKARFAKVNVVLNAWELHPKTNMQGAKVRGGPQLSGKLPEQIPALCDIVLRAMHEPKRKPWSAVYRCTADPAWVMKDRFNIATVTDPAPMNLAELIRASGRVVSRHPDYPEMEEWVTAIAGEFSGTPEVDFPVANDFYSRLISSGTPPHAARWTLRDALDRAVIRNAMKAANDTFI